MKPKHNILFITGIDTDAGKTYATAFIARMLLDDGDSVVTQKFIQTGCKDQSEDIVEHRRLCGVELLPEDIDGTTAPIIFSYPASAQLAAAIDGRTINLDKVDASTKRLAERYDYVLIEGAGGLMVPIDDDTFTIDYIASRHLPVVLVTNARLGSINHTVLSLEAIRARGIELAMVVFNHHFDQDKLIAEDTLGFIRRYVQKHFGAVPVLEMPSIKKR